MSTKKKKEKLEGVDGVEVVEEVAIIPPDEEADNMGKAITGDDPLVPAEKDEEENAAIDDEGNEDSEELQVKSFYKKKPDIICLNCGGPSKVFRTEHEDFAIPLCKTCAARSFQIGFDEGIKQGRSQGYEQAVQEQIERDRKDEEEAEATGEEGETEAKESEKKTKPKGRRGRPPAKPKGATRRKKKEEEVKTKELDPTEEKAPLTALDLEDENDGLPWEDEEGLTKNINEEEENE